MKTAFVFFILTCLSIGQCLECPSEFVKLEDRCYFFSKESANWVDAGKKCAQLKGRLVSIETEEESLTLLAHQMILKGNDNPAYWISATNLLTNKGSFLWASTLEGLTYTNWCKGEPNDYKKMGEHCVGTTYIKNGKSCWNDLPCDCTATWDYHPIRFICETDPILPPVDCKSNTKPDDDKLAYEIHIEQV